MCSHANYGQECIIWLIRAVTVTSFIIVLMMVSDFVVYAYSSERWLNNELKLLTPPPTYAGHLHAWLRFLTFPLC